VIDTGYKNEFDGSNLKPGEVVITFDDGPNPHLTPQVHKTISDLKIPAAFFFEVGENVELYPGQTKALATEGFIIGNHSYSHPDFVKLSNGDLTDQIDRTQKIITDTLGGPLEANRLFQKWFSAIFPYPKQVVAPEFFRSPYGSRNKRTMALVEKHFYHVMWNIDSLDWNDHSPATIEDRVFDQLTTEGRHGLFSCTTFILRL